MKIIFEIIYIVLKNFYSGYDVWMGNTRGNTYSRNHTTLDTCSSCHEFWSFGFDDSGNKDYPAEINYILDKTGEEKVHFIGHSMGTTQILVIWPIISLFYLKVKNQNVPK